MNVNWKLISDLSSPGSLLFWETRTTFKRDNGEPMGMLLSMLKSFGSPLA